MMIHVSYCVDENHSISTLQQVCSVVTSGLYLRVKHRIGGEGIFWVRQAHVAIALDRWWWFLLNFLEDDKTPDDIHHWLHSRSNVSRLLNTLWQTFESKEIQQLQEEKRPKNASLNVHIWDALPLRQQNVCSTRWCSHVCSSRSSNCWCLHGSYGNNMNG
jgi:hypothetical protein